MFASGLSVDYGPNVLIAKPGDSIAEGDGTDVGLSGGAERPVVGKQDLAPNIKLGLRFPSAQVLNHSDSRPWHLAQFLRSDGRFRILFFAGNLQDRTQWRRVVDFCNSISDSQSFLSRFTPPTGKLDSVIEILTIHSGPRVGLDLLSLPEILRPFDKTTGWDYDKVFVDDESYHEGHGEAYKKWGIEKEMGCVVILRPDQHVGWIGELEDIEEMDKYFSEILIHQR